MQHLLEQFIGFLRGLVKFWEGLQIELQGQYSPARLDELHTFTRNTGVLRAAAILLLTPVSCAVMTIALDVLPLRPPTEGIHQQSITYWLRLFLTYTVIAPCVILQFQYASARLPFRRTPFIAAVILIAAAAPVSFLSFHLLVGFPTPFTFQLIGLPLYPLFCGAFWAMWKTIIRGDTEVQKDLRQYILFSICQFTMLTLYPVMIFVFGRLGGVQQTIFSFTFPVLKLMFKNWASRGLFRLEDTTPVCIVASIDVFHALLLSCAMQSAMTRATLISVMAVDLFQSVIAFVEVRAVVKRLELLRLEVSSPEVASPLLSQAHRQTNILSASCSFLKSHPHIQNDPDVRLPRHQRQVQWRVFSSMSALWSPTRVAPVAGTGSQPNVPNTRPPLIKQRSNAASKRPPEVDYVRFTLKLLHMVEFYVLIEFIEVVVAAIYGMMQ
jgi:hypothetical protein